MSPEPGPRKDPLLVEASSKCWRIQEKNYELRVMPARDELCMLLRGLYAIQILKVELANASGRVGTVILDVVNKQLRLVRDLRVDILPLVDPSVLLPSMNPPPSSLGSLVITRCSRPSGGLLSLPAGSPVVVPADSSQSPLDPGISAPDPSLQAELDSFSEILQSFPSTSHSWDLKDIESYLEEPPLKKGVLNIISIMFSRIFLSLLFFSFNGGCFYYSIHQGRGGSWRGYLFRH
jgi:hypothetical protein